MTVESTAVSTPLNPSPAPSATCARCGCTSTLPELFRRSWRGRVCPRCAAENRLRLELWTWVLALAPALWAVVQHFRYTGNLNLWPLTPIPVIVLILIVLVILHEACHGLTAWLLGGRVFGLHWGVGPLIWQAQLGSINLSVSRWPLMGFCWFGFAQERWRQARYFCAILAPLLLHALFVVG